jgi:hypothetical protein
MAAALLAVASGVAANADDYGPASDVRAILAAVPILLAAHIRSEGGDPRQTTTSDVVIDGNNAIAGWSQGNASGLIGLERKYGLWWASGELQRFSNAPAGWTYWFSFRPGALYSGCIGATIGPIDGTLRDNTLHFELPPFTATPGTSLMGEIDGI